MPDLSQNDKPVGAALGWKLLDTTYPFVTEWLRLRQDRVDIEGLGEITYTYVNNYDAVGIVPITSDGKIILIKQYRYPVDQVCIEVPAGGMHDSDGAAMEDIARKELRQEIGATCGELKYVTFFYTATGSNSQAFHVYLALDTELGEQQELEPTELIEILPTPAGEALEMARSGQMKDGATTLSILLCEGLLREHGYI